MFVPDVDAVLCGEGDEGLGFEVGAVAEKKAFVRVDFFDVDFVDFSCFLEGFADFEVGGVEGFVDGLSGYV